MRFNAGQASRFAASGKPTAPCCAVTSGDPAGSGPDGGTDGGASDGGGAPDGEDLVIVDELGAVLYGETP